MCESYILFFFLLLPRPPTSTLFPYTTLFRSFVTIHCQNEPARMCHQSVSLSLSKLATHYGCDVVDSSLRSEEHTSELQSPYDLVCRLLLEKKKKLIYTIISVQVSIRAIVPIP